MVRKFIKNVLPCMTFIEVKKMTTNEKGKYWWLDKGEGCVMSLRSIGVTEEFKGKTYRVLGQKLFKHFFMDEPVDGQRTKICVGKDCPYCKTDNKASVSFRDVPITVYDGETATDYFCNMQKSLANALSDKINGMIELGKDPKTMKLKVVHTNESHPNNWVVEIIGEIGAAPSSGMNLLSEPDIPKKLTLTDDERNHLNAIAEKVPSGADKSDWITTLKEAFNWSESRATEVVNTYIVDGKFVE